MDLLAALNFYHKKCTMMEKQSGEARSVTEGNDIAEVTHLERASFLYDYNSWMDT